MPEVIYNPTSMQRDGVIDDCMKLHEHNVIKCIYILAEKEEVFLIIFLKEYKAT